MDHNEAIQQQAAVKYVLGELSQPQRDAYEEHYFDCSLCAVDVKAAAAFIDTSRDALRQEAPEPVVKPVDPVRDRWLAWLRPIVAVPAFAAILLLLGYQNFVTLPRWKNLAEQSTAPRVLPMFSLITANTRSAESLAFRVRPDEWFGLYVDVPADSAYSTYILKLADPAGHSAILSTVSYAEAQKTMVVHVNPGKQSGAYQIVVLGLSGQDTVLARATTLATIKFAVELNK